MVVIVDMCKCGHGWKRHTTTTPHACGDCVCLTFRPKENL